MRIHKARAIAAHASSAAQRMQHVHFLIVFQSLARVRTFGAEKSAIRICGNNEAVIAGEDSNA
ncbi:MAG: hypothetical protein FD164_1728 [Nitrospirae bacterium]|nr:MAG: hypothetical protein FD164_1728 [Nitrospirota bacterium]